MGHIRIELLRRRVFYIILLKFGPTVIAVVRSQMIFVATALAVTTQLSAWHRDEGTVRAINDFQVSDDKGIFDRDGAEASQAIF